MDEEVHLREGALSKVPFNENSKNLNKDLNPMVDEQNVCREVKYRQIAVTHRLVDVNESRFIRSCSFVSVCFPQSAF